jgi:hypothetical protein
MVPGTEFLPELSRFYGIVIRMYIEVGGPHQRPHFHAYCADATAVYAIDPVGVLAGSLTRRAQRLVEAWAELHQSELRTAWARLQDGQLPGRIEPLR